MRDTVRLEELVCVVNDKVVLNKDPSKPYLGLEHLLSRKAYIAGFAPSTESISTNSVFTKGDVLFGKLRPNLRKAVSAPFDGYCSTDILVLRARDNISSGFAGRVFQSEKVGAAAERTAVGTKMPRTSWKHLKQEMVFAPLFQEQQLIAEILDTLDSQIRQTEALIAKLEHIKQGLLTDLLTRGIDPNGRLRPTPDQAPHLYKNSLLGCIPKEWDARKLCELTAKIIDGSHQTPTYTRSGVPFLRVTDIQSEFIDLAEVKFISQREHHQFMARCDPRKGDLLLSKNGTVGIAKIVDWDWEFSIFVSLALIRVREPQEIMPKFLETVLNSDIVRRQIEKRSKQGTVTNLHLEEIKDFDIPVPSEEEQKAIAQHANTYWSRLKVERDELKKLLMEKTGLMDDLLTGRVRVASLLETKVRATA